MEPVGPAPVLDEHGFVVPRNLVSKFRSLQTRGATAGGGGRSATASASARHNWPELLAQAAKKQYRAGGPASEFVAAVADGIPTPYRAQAWILSGAAHNRDAQPQLYPRPSQPAAACHPSRRMQWTGCATHVSERAADERVLRRDAAGTSCVCQAQRGRLLPGHELNASILLFVERRRMRSGSPTSWRRSCPTTTCSR